MTLKIIYSDSDIVVINKPGGLLSVPGRGADKQDCVAKNLRNIFPEMIEQPAVHRLDMYTSGLMVFAMHKVAHRFLNKQFEQRLVSKNYISIVEGTLLPDCGEIRLSFRLDLDNRPKQIYDPVHGKLSITQWKKLEPVQNTDQPTTRILFTPLTGRTHQLRIHAAHPLGLDSPIVGDSLYGTGQDGDIMMLHASNLGFIHPTTKKQVSFTSEPDF